MQQLFAKSLNIILFSLSCMVSLEDITESDEEHFQKSVRITIDKPRVWDPENEGYYKNEDDFFRAYLTPR